MVVNFDSDFPKVRFCQGASGGHWGWLGMVGAGLGLVGAGVGLVGVPGVLGVQWMHSLQKS